MVLLLKVRVDATKKPSTAQHGQWKAFTKETKCSFQYRNIFAKFDELHLVYVKQQ